MPWDSSSSIRTRAAVAVLMDSDRMEPVQAVEAEGVSVGSEVTGDGVTEAIEVAPVHCLVDFVVSPEWVGVDGGDGFGRHFCTCLG